jgi:hypothetical protein
MNEELIYAPTVVENRQEVPNWRYADSMENQAVGDTITLTTGEGAFMEITTYRITRMDSTGIYATRLKQWIRDEEALQASDL